MKTSILSVTMCLVAVLAILIGPANAAVTTNDKTAVVGTAFVPCAAGGAGETVDFSGIIHTVVSGTINGNDFSGAFHENFESASGTGETTGDKYQFTGSLGSSFHGSFVNSRFTSAFVQNFGAIGQGPGNNVYITETLHITINADGTVTVFHDNISMLCR